MIQEIVRTRPRISVNKLGEYLVASPRRRRSIIADQKKPKAFQTARYTDAQDAIAEFLSTGAQDYNRLQATLTRLRNSAPVSDWDSDRIHLCIEAIESIMDFTSFDFLDGMNARFGNSDPPKLLVAGVGISVRPEIILSGTDKQGRDIVGAVKLYIGKSIPLREESANYVATTVHHYLERFHDNQGLAPFRHCHVVDVFSGKVFQAPRAFQARREDIAAACEEIARGWADSAL